jgi:hypothetical protein
VIQAFSLVSWRDFYIALATATAALLGLLFVAMSVRANQIGESPVLRKRARISIQGMATILLLALVALIPGLGNLWFSIAILVMVLVNTSAYVIATGEVVRRVGSQSRGPWIRTVANGISGLFALSTAVSLSLNVGGGLYLLVPGLLIVLSLWCIAAWHLIVPPELGALGASAERELIAGKPRKRVIGRRRG